MNQLRLSYIHNVPGEPVYISVYSVQDAVEQKETIANLMLNLQAKGQIPDYSNVFFLEVLENGEWSEWTSDDGQSFEDFCNYVDG